MTRKARPTVLTDDPLWYQKAIIYQLHVRSFFDGNADGIGDFPGLTQKLDYLQDLGVTAIWMLPFYPSPLRDGGYDISDYTDINPEYGTMRDFRRLVDEAHARGLRVITEVVLNHTSDQHEWFQRARHAPQGSPEREWYVWTDDPSKYSGVRIIFQDFEASNWSWDPVAKQYYWHRFYHHQPDLNFASPDVRQAVKDVVDFWLDTGVDGLRLDAIPYLYEQEGTNCENLPQTHDFLKELRAHVDGKYRNRMLLAEANMWPEDTRAYFGSGDGDECHMAFNFPVMPRMYMSVQMEDRYPLVDIMHQTPPIPAKAQWALFLRNHDELTLEMVTDEERDYMWRTYADDPRARINMGIRRRLAPLQKNNRAKIELLNSLLMSLPGTPIVYYGDEIGMGDNIYLGDRDGVRTPMQWNADRNAGFSTANPQQLFLPVVIDPEYRYEAINVATQQNNPSSLLVWMRRLIAQRKRFPVFGSGSLEMLHPDNSKILAYLRADDEQTILVVANLSRFPQPVELDLADFRDLVPVEVFGGTRFPAVADQPYQLTMAPHSFLWFRMEEPTVEEGGEAGDLPEITVPQEWTEVLTHRASRDAFAAALPLALKHRSWFNPKQRMVESIKVVEYLPIRRRKATVAEVVLVEVSFTEGEPEIYQVPIALRAAGADDQPEHRSPANLVTVRRPDGELLGTIIDAVHDEQFAKAILDQILKAKFVETDSGDLVGLLSETGAVEARSFGKDLAPTATRQSLRNSSITFGDALYCKVFRRVDYGVNPEWEIGKFLSDRTDFANAPATYGALELRQHRQEPRTLFVLQRNVEYEQDGWTYSLDKFSGYQEDLYEVLEEGRVAGLQPATAMAVFDDVAIADEARALLGPFLTVATTVGEKLADLHQALASDRESPALRPEIFPSHYQRQLYQAARSKIRNGLRKLGAARKDLPPVVQAQADDVLASEQEILSLLEPVKRLNIDGLRMRTHGDMHLGQVLVTGTEIVFIDFEGRPTRFISQRRDKRSPLRDLAGLVRSVDLAGEVSLHDHLKRFNVRPDSEEGLAVRHGTLFASSWLQAAMTRGYLDRMRTNLLTENGDANRVLMLTFLLEKAAVELQTHLRDKPSQIPYTLSYIQRLLAEETAVPSRPTPQ